MTTIASVTYDRAAFWRRTALRSQEQCVQYLERIEEQDERECDSDSRAARTSKIDQPKEPDDRLRRHFASALASRSRAISSSSAGA